MKNSISAICLKQGSLMPRTDTTSCHLSEVGRGDWQLLLCLVLGLPVSPGKHHQGGG